MKKLVKRLVLFLLIGFMSCSTTELIEFWKNPEVESFEMTKVLVIGMTPNIEARKKFEEKLVNEFKLRGIDAVKSLDILEESYTIEDKAQKQIKIMDAVLTSNFYDAIIFTKVKGVEDKEVYAENYKNKEYLDVKFKDDYFNHRDIITNPNYYEKYKVYHAETSLYCICPTKDRELIWKGFIDIIDPVSVEETVDDYVNLLILALEEQSLLTRPKIS